MIDIFDIYLLIKNPLVLPAGFLFVPSQLTGAFLV